MSEIKPDWDDNTPVAPNQFPNSSPPNLIVSYHSPSKGSFDSEKCHFAPCTDLLEISNIGEAIDDEWCTPTGEMDCKLDPDIILSAKAWPTDVSPKHEAFREEVLSLNLSIGERTWNRIERECTELLKSPQLKGNGIELNHLIALSLCFGDYRFHQLQQYLVNCISEPICIREIQSIYHWKTLLEDAFVNLSKVHELPSLNTPSVLKLSPDLQSVLAKYIKSTQRQMKWSADESGGWNIYYILFCETDEKLNKSQSVQRRYLHQSSFK